ncbi:thiamine pyrophosphate-binding protein [Acrocarpospora macrocephala]|uniref:Acetolactate synthase n=2 Tax=Acrocarpospora macrocephala TaxID=150177 RepID=A0A5M3WIY5_9ACTN|nr:acetolactate synthase [Acrocarpospora macrocephala]
MPTPARTGIPVYRYLAQRFYREDVRAVFVLTGDGNMYWDAVLAEYPDVRSIHVRHEHCAVSMALAYAQKSGRLGVASVTCGPGLTQTMTALATAAAARIPLLMLAGEGPLHSPWYNQGIDQAPLVRATGAEYIQVHSLATLPRLVTQAFYLARAERRPVVLGVPMDLQQEMIDIDEHPVGAEDGIGRLPDAGSRLPHPEYIRRAAQRVRSATRIVVLAGRGATAKDATDACVELAELCDAALATTLPVRGLFAGHPRSIGVAGGFSHAVTREVFDRCDLVIAVGASMTSFTTNSGQLIDPQRVLQLDDSPGGLRHARAVASSHVGADAAAGVRALFDELTGQGFTGDGGWDVASYASRVRAEPADRTAYDIKDGYLDPRSVIEVFDRLVPRDWEHVNAAGHCGYFATHMHDVPAAHFLTIREFGAVGNGISYAAGVAIARPGSPVILVEGDGGVMMHVQELETLQRYGLKILICVLNDGAFGSEVHKLRAAGLADRGATYGRNDIARVARGFGLRGLTIRQIEDIPPALEEFASGSQSMLLDILVSDSVMSPGMNRRVGGILPARRGAIG